VPVSHVVTQSKIFRVIGNSQRLFHQTQNASEDIVTVDRRSFLSAAVATAAVPALTPGNAMAATSRHFPKGFLWGAAGSGHQVEGNDTNSDAWLLENVKPTLFSEPVRDAGNSFALWPVDLDLARHIGLNTYRFSIEWSRIEPEPGLFSIAMLDFYKAMIDGCRTRGLTPIVTFNHSTVPQWFAARGSWANPESPDLFARYCDHAARHLAGGIGYALTLSEPNNGIMVRDVAPEAFAMAFAAMNAAAGKACGAPGFRAAVLAESKEAEIAQANLVASHKAGKAAIKAVRGDLPVGLTLALPDDEAVGPNSVRDAKRAQYYGVWLDTAKSDDFLGINNYDRICWDDKGRMAPLAGARLSISMSEVYVPSLANAVRYAHAATGVPIFVTENGMSTVDDAPRAQYIPAVLAELQKVSAEGVPLIGYLHWSLLDNFEWFSGFKIKFGLCEVDRTTFKRTPKPSAVVLGAIARRNAV
jgi:beta-glucosidase